MPGVVPAPVTPRGPGVPVPEVALVDDELVPELVPVGAPLPMEPELVTPPAPGLGPLPCAYAVLNEAVAAAIRVTIRKFIFVLLH